MLTSSSWRQGPASEQLPLSSSLWLHTQLLHLLCLQSLPGSLPSLCDRSKWLSCKFKASECRLYATSFRSKIQEPSCDAYIVDCMRPGLWSQQQMLHSQPHILHHVSTISLAKRRLAMLSQDLSSCACCFYVQMALAFTSMCRLLTCVHPGLLCHQGSLLHPWFSPLSPRASSYWWPACWRAALHQASTPDPCRSAHTWVLHLQWYTNSFWLPYIQDLCSTFSNPTGCLTKAGEAAGLNFRRLYRGWTFKGIKLNKLHMSMASVPELGLCTFWVRAMRKLMSVKIYHPSIFTIGGPALL